MTSFIKDFKEKFKDTESSIKKKTVGVVFGGFGEERLASLETGEPVYQELLKNGFKLIKIDPAKKDFFRLIKKCDVVFNCLHGEFGESGHLSAILDYMNVPYTFSGLYASSVCMDKLYFKSILKKLNYLTPLDNYDELFHKSKPPFYIQKKIRGGGSIGMKIGTSVSKKDDYFTEYFIDGKILTMGVLEKDNKYEALGIVEIDLKGKKFYDKDSKYLEGFCSYKEYKGRNQKYIKEVTENVFEFVGIKGCARIDFIEKNNKVYILEINTVPGLYYVSNLVYSAQLCGLSFYELLIWIINNAIYPKLWD